jgi:hypothetical protein
MAQYDAVAVIPIDKVVRDYFPHLSVDKFVRKVALGDIKIPMIRIEAGTQKSAKGIHIDDLAGYLDERRAAAVKESKQMVSFESPSKQSVQPPPRKITG